MLAIIPGERFLARFLAISFFFFLGFIIEPVIYFYHGRQEPCPMVDGRYLIIITTFVFYHLNVLDQVIIPSKICMDTTKADHAA
jgi:hypothetical protein